MTASEIQKARTAALARRNEQVREIGKENLDKLIASLLK